MGLQRLQRDELARINNNRAIGQFPIGNDGKVGSTTHCLCDLIGKGEADSVMDLVRQKGVQPFVVPRSDGVVAVIAYSGGDAFSLHSGNCCAGFDTNVFRAKPEKIELNTYTPPRRRRS